MASYVLCLTFLDEVFDGMGVPSQGQDIPHDLFRCEDCYLNRQRAIDNRYEQVKSTNLPDFINQQTGVSNFIIWNEDELRMVEIKKVREQVRESQLNWLSWMVDENIPVEIVRVKAV